MPSIASAAPNITPARMHSSVRCPITRLGTDELRRRQLRRPARQRFRRRQHARRDHAAEEHAVGRDAVERRRRAHVDDDRVARVEPARGERVDDPIGADRQRFVDVERDRKIGARVDDQRRARR